MPRRDFADEEEEEVYLEEEEEDMEEDTRRVRKRRRRDEKEDEEEEDEEEEEEEDDDDDEDYGASTKRGRATKKKAQQYFDIEAEVDDDDEEEDDEEAEDDFIVESGAEIPDEDALRRPRRPAFTLEDEQEDIDDLARQVHERYASRSSYVDYGEEATDVEQRAHLPSVRDPKLFMVKCAIGHERETAICLMQKFIDRPDLQITSVVALDHLKNYIYVEAEKLAYVTEACKGMRNIYASAKPVVVPIKEMSQVLSVESKSVDLSRDSWVRMKIGIYKGDLAKVVDVDNVRQKVTVKLIPRIDLQALANKMEGRDVPKKAVVPPPRFFNVDEAREMRIRVDRRRDRDSGEFFEMVDGMMLKDGFLYKTVSTKSIRSQGIQPTFDELEKFKKPGDDINGDIASLSTLFANRKKGHFMKGDAVIIVKGDLKNLEGWVEKVENDNVTIRPKMSALGETLRVKDRELCKYFKPGDHVKVVSGVQEGATGMVVKVEGHILIILSDTTKEHIRVFADHVVESSEITTGITRIGDYELHDLVLLDNLSFGVIIRVESEAFQILKGTPDRPETVLVKLREIKSKIDRKTSAKDRSNNIISAKDIVRVVEGPLKGKQGPVEHIHKGILFIYDRHHLEHSGFICAKAQSCLVVGGSAGSHRANSGNMMDRQFNALQPFQSPGRLPPRGPPSNAGGRFRGGRGNDSLVSRSIKIISGPFKGYRGRVKEVTGELVRVELESQMKIVTVKRENIADTTNVATPFREPRYSYGGETPLHPSRTPLHPIQTPLRDPGATPIHDGMRTPMRSRAWAPMSPPRDNWEEGNPATWGSSPIYHDPGTPPARPYEAPTPGSGWANTPGVNYTDSPTPRDRGYANAPSPYVPSTPVGQPMTPNSGVYLPGTPGGQPMTPGNVGMDVMSPIIGGEGETNWLLPDILVNILRPGEDSHGVVKEVLSDGSCKVSVEPSGDVIAALPTELEVLRPRKNDKIKILNGSNRGCTGRLIGIDGSDCIVKLDENLEVKILDMAILAKLAT